MKPITDQLREDIERQVAAQNIAAAKRSVLILKCELVRWQRKHFHRGLKGAVCANS